MPVVATAVQGGRRGAAAEGVQPGSLCGDRGLQFRTVAQHPEGLCFPNIMGHASLAGASIVAISYPNLQHHALLLTS